MAVRTLKVKVTVDTTEYDREVRLARKEIDLLLTQVGLVRRFWIRRSLTRRLKQLVTHFTRGIDVIQKEEEEL